MALRSNSGAENWRHDSKETFKRLQKLGGPAISHIADVTIIDPQLKPVVSTVSRFAGPAFPIKVTLEDVSGVSRACYEAPAGSVLAIEIASETSAAIFGGLSALEAARAHLAGVIVDGHVCDIEEIEEAGVAVFARGLSPAALRLSVFSGDYEIGASIGDVAIHPGDIIVGCEEGAVIVCPSDVDAILAAEASLAEREMKIKESLKKGTPLWNTVKEMRPAGEDSG